MASLLGAAFVPLAVAEPASAQAASQGFWTEEPIPSSPSGLRPPARVHGGAAYAAARDEVIVFGGYGSANANLADTWSFHEGAWVQRCSSSTCGPAARRYPAMAYDPTRDRIVLFGGFTDSGSFLGDTWEWNGLGWVNRCSSPCGASARAAASMAWDPVRQKVVLTGGSSASGYLADTYTWDGATAAWVPVSGADPTPARDGATVAFDPLAQRLVLYGGHDGTGALDDTWSFDGTNWVEECDPCSPGARYAAMSATDLASRRALLFGGATGTASRGDTWVWSALNHDWIRVATLGPSARYDGAMAAEPSRVVLFGGYDGSFRNDTWTFVGNAVEEPPLPDFYPSDDCDDDPVTPAAEGTNVLSGYVESAYLRLRTASDPADADVTWVCLAADDGATHLGGRLVVDGAPGTPQVQDGNAAACAADPNNERVQAGMLLGQPYFLDVTPDPGGDAEFAWVCVQAMGTGVRLRVTTASGAGTEFLPDTTLPHAPYAEEAWPVAGQPSAACKGAASGTRTRLVNLRVGASDRVALYAWQESSARSHVCFRGVAGATAEGGRITADAGAPVGVSPVVITANTLGPCTFPVVTRDDPPPTFGVWTSDPNAGAPPASACAEVTGAVVRATVGTVGPATVAFHEDTA